MSPPLPFFVRLQFIVDVALQRQRIDINPLQGFSICASHSICRFAARYALRRNRDLYHIEW